MEQPGGGFAGKYGITDVLEHDAGGSLYVLTYASGLRVQYHDLSTGAKAGRLDRVVEVGGEETVAAYGAGGELEGMSRTRGSGQDERGAALEFSYGADGKVSSAVFKLTVGGEVYPVRQALYTYYESTSSHGGAGDLRTAELQLRGDGGGSSGGARAGRGTGGRCRPPTCATTIATRRGRVSSTG